MMTILSRSDTSFVGPKIIGYLITGLRINGISDVNIFKENNCATKCNPQVY